ncbi:hypothetical protein ABFV57_32185, partial [Pseudomonas neuropathica]|uniref:hypothetical protein n=1 Tax=Pseudomonas neuropathica TaxID=2730425 RepID=UPI0034D54E4E
TQQVAQAAHASTDAAVERDYRTAAASVGARLITQGMLGRRLPEAGLLSICEKILHAKYDQ